MIEALNTFVVDTLSLNIHWSLLISIVTLALAFYASDDEVIAIASVMHFISLIFFLSGFREKYHIVTLVILVVLFYLLLFLSCYFLASYRKRWKDL